MLSSRCALRYSSVVLITGEVTLLAVGDEWLKLTMFLCTTGGPAALSVALPVRAGVILSGHQLIT
jgi:hypothetical protein